MHAAHAHSRFAVLALTVAFATLPAARTAAIPPCHALAAHKLNDPTTTPSHPPRFYNGNADYVSRPNDPFRRRTAGDFDSITDADSCTDLKSLTDLDSITDVRSVTDYSKRGDLGSDTGLLSDTSFGSLTDIDSLTELGSVTKYNLSRRGGLNSLTDLDSFTSLGDLGVGSLVRRVPKILNSDADGDSNLLSSPDRASEFRDDVDSSTTLEKRAAKVPNSGASILVTPAEGSSRL